MADTHKILVGSYTDSIYTLTFDPDASTLRLLSQVDVGHRPSWIEAHPSDRLLVFASLEQADGQIVAVKYDADGKGHKADEATCTSGGADPCTLLVTEDELIVGNYSCGTLSAIPISTRSPYTHPNQAKVLALPFEANPGGRDPARQESSHPHQIMFSGGATERREFLVPDLGSDTVWRLSSARDSLAGGWEAVRGFVSVKTGGGPRHVAMHGNTLYVLLELTSELAVYALRSDPRVGGTDGSHRFPATTHLTTLSTLRASPTPGGMAAAEILIPKPNGAFPAAYIYVSNREDPHPEGDTIAVFSLEKGEERPELVSEVRTGLRHVRGMAFGGKDDRWLVIGGVGSQRKDSIGGGGVKIYERVQGGRDLRQVAELDSAVGSRLKATAFLWL